MKRVAVIEDDPILLNAYGYYINEFENYELVGLYTHYNEALLRNEFLTCEILITDISLPGISWEKGLLKFREVNKEAKIIVASVHNDFNSIQKGFELGVDGYLTKPITQESLVNALYDLQLESIPLSREVLKKLVRYFKKEEFSIFSAREKEVLDYFRKGLSYKAIAEKLFITPSAVNFHIQNIYTKLNVNNRSDAINKLQLLELGEVRV